MTVSVQTPTTYPIIVPTTSSLRTFNFYLVENEGKLFLVDAGEATEDCWQALIEVLDQNHFSLTDIDAIVLTHNHADHIGLVNRIRSLHSLPVFAHQDAVIRLKRDRAFLEKRLLFFEQLYKEMGCGDEVLPLLERLKKSIDENEHQKIAGDIETFVAGDYLFGFEIIEVPGHAPDHIALFHEKSGMMFVGDHIIKHSSTNALVELAKDGERIPSLEMYEQSLKKLLHFDVKIAYSGHGEVIQAPHHLIRKKLARIKEKATKIIKLLDEPRTPAEIAKLIYKNRYETLLSLVMSEVIGHIDRLESMELIKKEKQGNVFYYEVN